MREINRFLKLPETKDLFFVNGMSTIGGTAREANEYFGKRGGALGQRDQDGEDYHRAIDFGTETESVKATMQESVSEHANSLGAPAPRTHVHTRAVEYRGYRREDGLWDIEAELTDTKTYAQERPDGGVRPAGEPVHGMVIRLTVDDDMKITDVAVGMPATPFPECQQAKPSDEAPRRSARLDADGARR